MGYLFKTVIVVIMVVIPGINIIHGETLKSPGEILKASDIARGSSNGLEWIIKIESVEKGKKKNNTLKLMADKSNSLAEFIMPARVKGRKLLMRDRNMWFVKPGLSKPVPISPRQKLLGSASNGDIASTSYAGDYTITQFDDNGEFNNQPCFLFDLKAKNKKVTYDRIRYWVSKDKLVGIKADFYTVSGKLFKSAQFEYDNSITVNGMVKPFVSKMVIKNKIFKDDITTMYYKNIKIKKIPDSTFNLNLLMR